MDNSIIQQTERNKILAANYINAVGQKQLQSLSGLLDANVGFNGPLMKLHTASDLITAFKQLGTVLHHNEIKKIFADEDDACIIYDLILDENSDAVPCIEWIKIKNDKITSIQLLFDSKLFLKIRGELLANRSRQNSLTQSNGLNRSIAD